MTGSESTEFGHAHSFLGNSHDENARRTRSVVALTFIMMIGEIVAGYMTGSMALLADGFHMATHAGALGIAVFAYRYAKRNSSNRNFSFGTGKVGELAGFASALILALVSLGIGVESALRLIHPADVQFGQATIIAVVGLAVNIISALMLSGGSHHQHHDHHHGHSHASDNNLRSAYVHVLADALTSILAIGALLAGRYLGWVWLDAVMGIVGSVVIARWAWTLMRDTAGVLLDKTDQHVAQEVRDILACHNDAELADLHVWQIGPEARAAIVSVRTRRGVTAETLRERLAPVHEIMHLTIETVR
ncbi:CDF family Co(II)/Ni(II) efflux transporter DmeF [Caballeronia sp. LZ035]|uniref:CDF family Co(II)/Ni(II) efflux transporter DmeF n=1 Tax=Caballeronia sp. LZ035 TaxID=3038568 RepID=UPI0028597E79|nr:CDF family Co(II)/Ni(II) efflux transporter DmeF [Caballeronia sp. LZ035]MDR5759095.1 CDF family Co(II)/Ni(II) efflux transporter DmeF [Caballeronia sp. LZ035]